jgi:Domain of unknown function (DUF6538)
MARGRRWYLHAKVPVDLAGFPGRHENWRSLGTGDHAAAVKLYRRTRADLDTWFDEQRRRRDAGERLNGEAPRLVTQWFHHHERRAADLDFGLVGEVLQSATGGDRARAGRTARGRARRRCRGRGQRGPARERPAGSPAHRRQHLDPGGPRLQMPPTSTGRPCPDRFQVLIELARRRRERLQGRPHVGYDPLFNGAVVQPGAKRDGADGITLGELIEQFSADRTARLSPGRSPNTTLCCGSYVMRGTSTYPSARSPASTAVRSGTLLRSRRRR